MFEERPIIFLTICAVWALAMIGLLISATRLCYAIEARSGRRPLSSSLPGYANLIPVAFNAGVAQDEETQRMRWRMNQRLLTILVGFGFFGLVINAA